LDVLPRVPADSIDAGVTDSPYELGFMGKSWDKTGVSFQPATWAETYRVLKPGARLLAFGGSRTSHRIVCAIEDAGFVIEDGMEYFFSVEEQARELWETLGDSQRDALTSGANPIRRHSPKTKNCYGTFNGGDEKRVREVDSGGASRFFYTAKASRKEREAGLEDAPKRRGGSNEAGFTKDVAAGLDRNRPVGNYHPTVKPIALMRYLVKLITPPGGLVLDQFCGSGTTGVACVLEGFDFAGIEKYADIALMAHRRIAHWEARK
jgi:DNA modification methylase